VIQLLPALSTLLHASCEQLASAAAGVVSLEDRLEFCVRLCRCSAECATALLPRSYTLLFKNPEPEPAVAVGVWTAYLTAFAQSIREFSQCTHSLESCLQGELAGLIAGPRQQLLEVALSLLVDVAKSTYVTPRAGNNPLQGDAASTAAAVALVALEAAAGAGMETVLVASIRAAAYSKRASNKNSDDFDEFRSVSFTSSQLIYFFLIVYSLIFSVVQELCARLPALLGGRGANAGGVADPAHNSVSH
jgi:hypothetical protein